MADAAWVALSLIRGTGGQTFRTLLDRFGSAQAVFAANRADLLRVKGVGVVTADAIAAADIDRTAQDIARWAAAGVRVLDWDSPDYPARLRDIPSTPPTLFVTGCWPCIQPRSVAIVGTRTPTPAAAEAAHHIAHQCVSAGITVISGLALGIDRAAHLESAAQAAPTVAVLGSGILNVYPPENRELARSMTRIGALVCEVRPDARVSAAGLVARNRIISGLADAVVIVQTDTDGGALHAARFAAQQGRTVFMVNDALGNLNAQTSIDQLRMAGARPLQPDVVGVDWLE